MIRNYLKIAWRNLKNNKFFSAINIVGLAIGLACCMLISLYLYREFSYDQHYKDADRIYQVGTVFVGGTKDNRSPGTPSPLGPAIQKEYPEVEMMTRLVPLFVDDKTLIQYNAGSQVKSFYETKGYMVDSTFFRIFNYDFIEGSPSSSLTEPNTLVLSEEIARKIFGSEPALNKTIHINSTTNGSFDYKVTGVYRKGDNPTHLDGRFFISLYSGDFGQYVRTTTNFSFNNMFSTYLLLKQGTSGKSLDAKLPAFVNKYMAADLKTAGFSKKQFLIPLKDIHLRSGFGSESITAGDSVYGNITYLYILGAIALFILIIACINFMNLATARSARRAAEVGIRKVLGAEKKSLIGQFLGESMLLAYISLGIGLLLMFLLMPVFSKVAGVNLHFDIRQHYPLLIGFIALTLVSGMIAGSYPAFYLSAFKPIKVLKGKFSNSLAAVNLRRTLVVFQFAISAGLIICALVIGKQMNYMRTTDMGFRVDQQIVIPLRSTTAKNIYPSLKNELAQIQQISSVGASLYYPGIFNPSDQNFYLPGQTVNEAVNLKTNWVDDQFMQTLSFKPVAGRLFSKDFPADTMRRIVVNEAAIRKFGFKTSGDAIGKDIMFSWKDSAYHFTIVGVVRDFNFESLQKPINPYAFQLMNESNFNYMVAHASGEGNMRNILDKVQAAWKKLNPTEPFEYSFVDQDFQKNYEGENRLASLIQYFMFIAIAICCLGLFGLAAFSAEQRTKEIGIRKVLGSSVVNIMGLLSKDFVKLVLIGNIIAIPVAWYLMNKWLRGFEFKTSLDWWLFGIALMLSVFIALLTVSYQALRSALANPIKSLRSE